MTSAQTMESRALVRQRMQRRLRLRALFVFVFIIVALSAIATAAGCQNKPRLRPPITLHSPYDRPQLWAVAPLNNESGVSQVDGARVADLFVEQVEQTRGLNAVPVNRVIMTMRRLRMPMIATQADAMKLMNALGVDGLIVGTVTAWDPYRPPKFGAAVQLFQREQPYAMGAIDPVQITRATTDRVSLAAASNPSGPIAQASGVFDGSNHQVLKWIDEYAVGRVEPGSAYGSRIYLVNMELYTQFAAFRLTHDLLAHERSRLSTQIAAHTNKR